MPTVWLGVRSYLKDLREETSHLILSKNVLLKLIDSVKIKVNICVQIVYIVSLTVNKLSMISSEIDRLNKPAS